MPHLKPLPGFSRTSGSKCSGSFWCDLMDKAGCKFVLSSYSDTRKNGSLVVGMFLEARKTKGTAKDAIRMTDLTLPTMPPLTRALSPLKNCFVLTSTRLLCGQH